MTNIFTTEEEEVTENVFPVGTTRFYLRKQENFHV